MSELPMMPTHSRSAADCMAQAFERLRKAIISADWDGVAAGLQVTVSIGLAHAPPHDGPCRLAPADSAPYAAKQAGRDRVSEHADGSGIIDACPSRPQHRTRRCMTG